MFACLKFNLIHVIFRKFILFPISYSISLIIAYVIYLLKPAITHAITGCYINGSSLTNKFLELKIGAEKRYGSFFFFFYFYSHLKPPRVRDVNQTRTSAWK